MKAFLIVLLLVVVGVVTLGFYRGWFRFTSDSDDATSNITLTVDQDKFQDDRKAAAEGVQGLAPKSKDTASRTSMDGTLVSIRDDQLTMTNKEGKEHSHPLTADVRITCDGISCKAADLKPGMKLRVTTEAAAPHVVTRIKALDKKADFE